MFFLSKKCSICGHKATSPRYYLDADGKKLTICIKCVPYAERRVFRKR